jgi:hypothetical protein
MSVKDIAILVSDLSDEAMGEMLDLLPTMDYKRLRRIMIPRRKYD